jgi:hypothetical protein
LQLESAETEEQKTNSTHKDGIYLSNIDSCSLDIIIDYLYNMNDPKQERKLNFPSGILALLSLLNICEYLDLQGLKHLVILELLNNDHFLKYSNVRRHVVDNL